MLRSIPASTTVSLLDFLVPSLICRSRTLSTAAASKPSNIASTLHKDALLEQRKLRAHLMEQGHANPIVPDSLKKSHNESLVEITQAIGARNLTQALRAWGKMKMKRGTTLHDELYRLPLHNQRQISQLFNLTDDMKTIARDFALEAAANDISEALYTLMFAHIERNESDAAIDLYISYQDKVERPVDQESQLTDPAFLEPDDDQSYNPSRVSLLLAVITAYALRDSFHDALRTYLAADLRPPVYRKQKLFDSLSSKADLKQKVQKYLDRLAVAAMVSKPAYLSKRIIDISTPKSTKDIERLYNDVIDGISGPEPYLAANASSVSPERPVAMSESGWTAFQTGFLKIQRPDLAANVWKDLEKCGFTPGVSMWTALLDTYAKLRNSRQAMITWNTMLDSGVKPDTFSYRAIISALFDDNKVEAALARFKEFHSRSTKEKNEFSILVYNTVLRGLLRKNRIADAKTVLQVMQSKGPAPDIISYNTFLASYCRHNDFKGLSNIVSQMSEADIPGDVVTFSTILTALLHAGRKDAPMTIINLMRKQGIQPNVATYTAIIDSQMREQTEESLEAALNILDKMEQDEDLRPNEVTYTSILSGLYRGSWLSPARAEVVKAEILGRMRRANIPPTIPTYHILIRAAVSSKDPNGYLDALRLLDEMEKYGLPRTNTLWYILFAGLMGRELWDEAKVMVEKMESSGHLPTDVIKRK
ncbi:hypothetical protein BJ912DRAFT_942962 [Pholiota molesta]|nr:hypothetical protein BJ912DRAFT_942962 [Pholiota molesta]